MSERLPSCRALAALLTTLALLAASGAQAAGAPKTRNVVLIVSDGLRWQEVFTGADPTLLNEKNGGIWEKESQLRKDFWRDDVQERRRVLLPFIWGTVANQGQIFGNQKLGSVARVTNGLAFSYPGYNEMLSGHPDKRIDSNEYGPNPNLTVYEWLNGQPGFAGRVAVYATWETFHDIFNGARSHLPMQVGSDPPYHGTLTSAQQQLNRLFETQTRIDDEEVSDALLQVALLDSLPKLQAQVLFVGYGETDDWGHSGRYDLLLRAAHHFDKYVGELWDAMQKLPAYKDKTTFILTADHGRGSGPVEWKEHGVDQKGSEYIWIAVIGPDTPALGERTHVAEVHQAQIAATLAAFLGKDKDYRTAVPAAAAPSADVLTHK